MEEIVAAYDLKQLATRIVDLEREIALLKQIVVSGWNRRDPVDGGSVARPSNYVVAP